MNEELKTIAIPPNVTAEMKRLHLDLVAKAKEFEALYADRADLIQFRQVAQNMSPASIAWEKSVIDGKICDGNPIMRQMVGDAVNEIRRDSGGSYGPRSNAMH